MYFTFCSMCIIIRHTTYSDREITVIDYGIENDTTLTPILLNKII